MTCPDPVRWLDWLEAGEPIGTEVEHLRRCPACEARVNALRQTAGVDFDLPSSPPWLDSNRLAFFSQCLKLDDGAIPNRGDVWLSAADFDDIDEVSYSNVDRLLFVVLDESICAAGRRWVDVAPIWTDTDMASDLDVVLDPEHTTLNTPLRFQPHRQLVMAWEQLEAKVGEVIDYAFETLVAAARGEEVDLRWHGTPYEGAFDWRIDADKWIAQITDTLRGPYAITLGQATESVTQAGDLVELEGILPLLHEFRRINPHDYALAAASKSALEALWIFDPEHRFEAWLHVEVATDLLRLTVKTLREDWANAVELLVQFRGGHTAETALRHGELEFGPAKAHGEREIERLYLRPLSEAGAR